MLVTPYQEITSLQFRVVNRRRNDLMEIEARVLLMTVEEKDGQPARSYRQLKLEREQVLFMPLTWTIVHPIDSESPLYGLTAEDFRRVRAEVMILIKAYDDTFSQTVLARYSYRYDEIGWNRHFVPAFSVDSEGDLIPRTHVLAALNTLENLKKGGRIGGATAMVGSLLSIKPVIDLSGGVVHEAGKARTRKRALQMLYERLAAAGPIEHVAVMHCGAPDIDKFLDLIAPRFARGTIRIGTLGAVVGVPR